ncbi:uncharacterized protein LOC126656606 [Mercurialis annua]|uniref:uncharacterized protein LOC126656606 n=1 Tax=Mercurialis annua TaxID=3986 RepID=UPI00215EB7FC|nr:uncharacterized protein LOC126656606 [Mercurialis annua]
MSKKKASAGNTMTLKDFHGGSIPSDLPLPSAPGVILRASEWSGGYDRPNSWGGPMAGRGDHHRPRPNSSPGARHFDDKTPFLSHTSHIGRHFDEDERKPLDGVSAPRRTVSDESFRSVGSSRVEMKPEPVSSGRVFGSAIGSQVGSSYSGRIGDGAHVGSVSRNIGGNNGQSGGSHSHPNVWAARKESAAGVNEPVQAVWSGASAVSKLAHASALEKVSSGRWQTKHSTQHQADVEVIEHFETDKGAYFGGHDRYAYNRIGAEGGREYSDAAFARHVERSLVIEDGFQNNRKEYVDHERTRNVSVVGDRDYLQRNVIRSSGPELIPPMQLESSERPKVNLLPRTKPLENVESPTGDYKQGYQHLSNSSNGHIQKSEPPTHFNVGKSGLLGESDNQVMERPKLNLKPRSHPLEKSEETLERERVALFGGARPRELVLKARGVDDVVNNHDMGQDPDRVKHNVPKVEKVSEHTFTNARVERTDNNAHVDQRTLKNFERKDQRVDAERVDKQKRIWRNENWRNGRDSERQQHQHQHQPQVQQERPPSPETWRKPIEQPKSASHDSAGLRYGKTASAMELAQAFSKSLSHSKPADRSSSQRSLPGKTQVPFSRLTGSTSRPQLNGY